jgi:hypothetical protein
MSILVIELSPESCARVRALAALPEVRGDHVTLAFGVARDALDLGWIPGRHPPGARVRVRAIGMCRDERVQALLVEVEGTTVRPHDGGRLHVTVSRHPAARSVHANELLACATPAPLAMDLEGVVAWRD